MQIRTATVADAAVLREIYRPYVETTAISFELEVPSIEEFQQRISVAVEGWSWLVAEVHGRQVGYAYGSAHRAREAYRSSVETSAYVHEDYHRQGIGRALYTQLLNELGERSFGSAFAGITLPNDASVGFHESLGFEPIGVFPRVGRKFGAWHDVAWLYRPIQDSDQD
ncbi:arsinothricin resistance N-acetyltransferase ArsN1 family B [Chloroflexota bacterium]